MADGGPAALAEHQPGAGLARPARAAPGRSGGRAGRLRGCGSARAGVLLREPVRAHVAQLRGAGVRAPRLARARAGARRGGVEIGRRFGAPEPLGEALRVRALLLRGGERVEAAREAVEVLAASDLR